MARAFAGPAIDLVEEEARNVASMPLVGHGMALHELRAHGFVYRCELDITQDANDAITATTLELLGAALATQPVIVTVHPGPLLRGQPDEFWRTRGAHGFLIQSPDQPAPWHAVLLIGVERRPPRFVYLDPFFAATGDSFMQPFCIRRVDFASAWIGEMASFSASRAPR